MTRTTLVLARSRPARNSCADFRAASKSPAVSGSPAIFSRRSAATRSRSSTAAALRIDGARESSDRRIKSIAARAIRGLTSHDGDRGSYSFWPREPWSWRNWRNWARKRRASSPPLDSSAAITLSGPASNAALTSADSRAARPSVHISCDGAAESTSIPASRRIASVGSPTPSLIAARAPVPSADSDETIIAFSNVCWT